MKKGGQHESRLCDNRPRNLPKIVRACGEEWSFEPDDFTRQRTDPRKQWYDAVIATAAGA